MQLESKLRLLISCRQYIIKPNLLLVLIFKYSYDCAHIIYRLVFAISLCNLMQYLASRRHLNLKNKTKTHILTTTFNQAYLLVHKLLTLYNFSFALTSNSRKPFITYISSRNRASYANNRPGITSAGRCIHKGCFINKSRLYHTFWVGTASHKRMIALEKPLQPAWELADSRHSYKHKGCFINNHWKWH